MKNNVKNIQEIVQDKEQRLMETIAWRAGFYRANPCRLVEDVWGIHLKLFQESHMLFELIQQLLEFLFLLFHLYIDPEYSYSYSYYY